LRAGGFSGGAKVGYYSKCQKCGQKMKVGGKMFLLIESVIIEDTDTVQEEKEIILCPDCAGQ
jgi:hypothetical protein